MNVMSIRLSPIRLPRLGRAARRLLDDALLAVADYRERRQLLRLDDRALRDVGITRTEARREKRRSIWDLPRERR